MQKEILKITKALNKPINLQIMKTKDILSWIAYIISIFTIILLSSIETNIEVTNLTSNIAFIENYPIFSLITLYIFSVITFLVIFDLLMELFISIYAYIIKFKNKQK